VGGYFIIQLLPTLFLGGRIVPFILHETILAENRFLFHTPNLRKLKNILFFKVYLTLTSLSELTFLAQELSMIQPPTAAGGRLIFAISGGIS
jgi:hypothetical protein